MSTHTMKPDDIKLTKDEVMQRLDYDPETGDFRWRATGNNRTKVGDLAGHVSDHGYRRITLSAGGRMKRVMAHRIAWLVVHGEWPTGFVDHNDGNKLNNRISNLRLATKAQNAMNTGTRRDNALGARGVTYRKAQTQRPYIAKISVDGKQKLIGSYATLAEAQAAYDAAALAVQGEWASTKRRACH